jgi:hypothetical protein
VRSRSLRSALAFFLFVDVFFPTQAFAADTLSINFPQSGMPEYGLTSNYWGAQKFRAGSNATLTSIQVSVKSGSLSAVSIRADNSDLPGTVLSTWTTKSSNPANTPNVQTFTGSVSVTSGSFYWIAFHTTESTAIYYTTSTSQSGSSGWSVPAGRTGAAAYAPANSGATWTIDSSMQSFSLRITAETAAQLTTPNAPVVNASGAFGVGVSETSATANASSYLVKLYSSNGVTLVDSKTVASGDITSVTIFTGLNPNTNYYASVTAIGDGSTYLNSNESSKSLVTTPKGETTVTISAPSQISFRQAATISAVTSRSGLVTFFSRNKRIPGCIKVTVLTTTASCRWLPAVRGGSLISAVFTPTDTNYLESNTSLGVSIKGRSNKR